MARDEWGTLIDPSRRGRPISRLGVLRHVSPAFVEDPLRLLRVARFAARFGFAVAPDTPRLMRALVATGEITGSRPSASGRNLPKACWNRAGHDAGVVRLRGARATDAEVDALYCRGLALTTSKTNPAARLSLALEHAAERGIHFAGQVRRACTRFQYSRCRHAAGRLAYRRCPACGAPGNVGPAQGAGGLSRRRPPCRPMASDRCSRGRAATGVPAGHSSTLPTAFAARIGSRRCCKPGNASRCRRPMPRMISRPRVT